ncbi:MAG: T9SS type A sorting domain-containing protein [Bacteroidia bacterium]|nr:T9SS type A sorting domain-containing protein [Bacteroidia bacterium]
MPAGEDVGVFAWNAATNAPASGNITARNFYVDAAASMSHTGDLTLSGNLTNEGAFATSGRVTFSGSATQILRGGGSTSFGSWTVNNAAGVTLESALTITSSITLSSGIVDLNSQTLTINSAASIAGVPGNSNHINATSGTLRKGYSSTGSFTFPVGDGTNYSPIALNFTSGSFASAYADVSLTASKHPNNTSSSNYINRYWTASTSGITDFSCDVAATYVDADIVGTESEYYGGKYSSGWTVLGPVSAASNQITGTVTGFSDFTAGELSAFPVEWISFEATSATKGVDLSWATASESNSHYFGVERSSDKAAWTEIGQVEAAGFSTEESHYLFTDLLPTSGENFYRLRQVDFDGRMDYSEVRSVWINESLRIYPNPVLETLNLELPTGDWQATMFDQQGRQVRSILHVGSTIDMDRMPAGIYYLLLENAQGQRLSERVVRQ